MNYKCIPIPYKNIKSFAALLEKHINELLQDGYSYQIIQVIGKPDVVIHARKDEQPQDNLQRLLQNLGMVQDDPRDDLELKYEKSRDFHNAVLTAVEQGQHRGAEEADVIANKVRTLDNLSVEIRTHIMEDMRTLAEYQRKSHTHKDGKECWVARTLMATAKEIQDRIKETQS